MICLKKKKNMNTKIFKTYDIRGVYPEELNEESGYLIGRAFPLFLEEKAPIIVVGKDGRNSSDNLFNKLKEGLFDSGAKVIDIGLSTTPLLNYAVAKNGYIGGIMVTASHNPPEFNGFKLIKKKALQIYGDDIKKIEEIIKKTDFTQKQKGFFDNKRKEILNSYISHIVSFGNNTKKLKIIADYANGASSVTGVPVFEKLNIEVKSIFDQIDGNFPNHLPNPAELKNLKTIIGEIKKGDYDLGVFFDGDGDRAFIIDERGEVVYPDILLAALSKEELSKKPGEKIYFDLRFSKITAEKIKEAGGIPDMMRVGNPFYKEKLINQGGLMGAELSGHLMHKDNFCIDDGLFMTVKTINFLSKKNKKLSEIVKPLKKYYQSEEINIKVSDKKRALQKIKNHFLEGKSYDIDGVYLEFEDWWLSVRESNTEDLVRIRLEANSKELLEEKENEVISIIES